MAEKEIKQKDNKKDETPNQTNRRKKWGTYTKRLHHTFGHPILQLWRSIVISLMLFMTWKPSIEN
jgi:hypothetical protein